MIVVVVTSDEIETHKEELFGIYKEMLKFEPEIIEFEVISVSEIGKKLSKTLNNPLGYYNNNWDEFNEISSYIDIRSKEIYTSDELAIWLETDDAKNNVEKVIQLITSELILENDLSKVADIFISEDEAAELEGCCKVYPI